MNRFQGAFLLLAVMSTPSCLVYDAELLEQAVGGEPGEAGGSSSSGGSGPTSGGSAGDGDASGGVSGDGDGDDVPTGGIGSGGGNPGSGGEVSGTGGMPADCDDIGTIGAFTGVSSTTILDDFERDWNKLGDGATYTGFWFVAKDDAENETLVPDTGAWGYETDVCSDTDALHITGSGFSTWGASFDAQLMAAVAAVDVSEFTGIAFWARSTGSNQLKLAISDADAGNGTTPIERPTTIFLGEQWEQHLVPFPAGATMDQATVVHLVVVAGASFDLWLDDVSFYVAE